MKALIMCDGVFQLCEIKKVKAEKNIRSVGKPSESLLILQQLDSNKEYQIPMSNPQANGMIKRLYTEDKIDLTGFITVEAESSNS